MLVLTALRRFDSTSAETTMLRIFSMWPKPIRWRSVGEQWVRFRHVEKRRRSIRVREMLTVIWTKNRVEPAGNLKCRPRWRSMERAWRMVKLLWIAIVVPRNMFEDQRGKILRRFLKSSTCWTVHGFHGFATIELSWSPKSPSVFKASWFRRFRSLHGNSIGQKNSLSLLWTIEVWWLWKVFKQHHILL